MGDEVKIGQVSHYFRKISVAAVDLTDGGLSVGDTIHVEGYTSDFIQKIESMQIDNSSVTQAEKGSSVGIRVVEHARVGDVVYKVTD